MDWHQAQVLVVIIMNTVMNLGSSINGGGGRFLDQLSDCQILKKYFAPHS